jgi:hypothetical protein
MQCEGHHHIVSVPIASVPQQKQCIRVHPFYDQRTEHGTLIFPVLVLVKDLRREGPFKPGRMLVGKHLEDVAVVILEPAAPRVELEVIFNPQLARREGRPNPGNDHPWGALYRNHQSEKEKGPSERATQELVA